MPYGRSYRYRGDPFLGDIVKGIGKVAGGVLKTVGGFVPGVGGVAQAVGGLLAPSRPQILPQAGGQQTWQMQIPPMTQYPLVRYTETTPAMGAAPGALPPRGYRLNKTGYYTRAGYVPPYSKYVKIRRTNPGNARALRRSLRRVESFAGLVSRTRKATRRVKKI